MNDQHITPQHRRSILDNDAGPAFIESSRRVVDGYEPRHRKTPGTDIIRDRADIVRDRAIARLQLIAQTKAELRRTAAKVRPKTLSDLARA